jgi:Ser-tRNA(Ala) deacylase AlaX
MKVKSNKQYHPQMHSAEHILNQTMVRMFGCERSFSNHIEKKKSKCDYRFERNLSPKEIKGIENRVNEVISRDFEVEEEFYSILEAEKIFNLSKLPDNAGGRIRVIKIGDYDACPCSGLHVSRTQEIGVFKIISASFENRVLRIRFKLGETN